MISFFGVGDSAITSLKLFSLVILPVVPFFWHVAVLALLLVLALLIVLALLVDLVVATVCWRLVELRCMLLLVSHLHWVHWEGLSHALVLLMLRFVTLIPQWLPN